MSDNWDESVITLIPFGSVLLLGLTPDSQAPTEPTRVEIFKTDDEEGN